MAKKLTTAEFIQNAINKHGEMYDYSKSVYINTRTKVTITCPEHGDFEQTPNNHTISGHGCPICRHIKSANSSTSNTDEFIKKANKVHQTVYDYSKVIYVSAISKVKIICPMHGPFIQRPADHLSGRGCKECSKEFMGWTDTKWTERGSKSKGFEGFKLYIIEMSNDNEHFIKIGKTFTSVSHRFCSIPYKWKLLKVIEGDGYTISEMERALQTKFKQNKYIPLAVFGGRQECFTIDILKEVLNELELFKIHN